MFRRSLAGVALAIGLGTASLSHALSLGELRLDSALNQPLEARIALKDVGSLSKDQITVKLASLDDFERTGVDYNYLLSRLDFSVSVDGKGDGVVRVYSREPIVEPYLNFLVEARWPAGRMLREYTVLLDLPVVSDARTSSVRSAEGGAASQAASQSPATRQEVVVLEETLEQGETATGPKPRADDERTSLPPAEQATEYRVQHNDMLWNIATEFRPEGATVQQTMLALLRKNPRAFIGDNINQLKSGYVLRLPTAEEAAQLGQADAVKEIRRQNAIWRGEAVPSDGELDATPQLDATEQASDEDSGEQSKPEARLSIATPGEADSEGAGGEADNQQLRDALAANEENLDRVQRENAELNSRLADLERQLATLQRLLELKDDQLATLQDQMAGADATEPAPVGEQPGDEASGLSLDNPLIRYGLIGLVILIILVLLLRRLSERKNVTETAFTSIREEGESSDNFADLEDDDGEAADDDDHEGHTTVIIEPGRKSEASKTPVDEDDEFDDLEDLDDLLMDDARDEEVGSLGDGARRDDTAPVEAETDDALAEAEIYVAYGRYEQAAQMLKGAIAKEPERTDLRVKLLDVYLETRDQANFMREFEALEALGDPAAIADVKESMSAVEGVSDWLRGNEAPPTATAPQAESSAEPELDDELDFDLDTDFTETEKQSDDSDDDTTLTFEDLEKDDDLDLSSFSFDDDAETKPGAAADNDSSFDLDDDFSLDDLDDSAPVGGAKPVEEDIAVESPVTKSPDVEEESLDLDDLDELGELDDLELDQPAERASAPAEFDDDEFADLNLDEDDDLSVTAPETRETAGTSGGLDDIDSLDSDELGDDLGLLGDSDEVATKLDLARAYIDMGDAEGAKDMLQEVLEEGSEEQQQDARDLLDRL